MKVRVLFEHSGDSRPHGCSHIRLLRPLGHPVNAGQLDWSAGAALDGNAEVVVVERMWQPATVTLAAAEELMARVRARGARLVYTLDDNLLDLEPWSAIYPSVTATQKMVVRLLAREADGVVVSTEPLRERLLRLNDRVTVIPNAVDEQLFRLAEPRPTRHDDRVVIGIMGTFSHEGDVMMILQALREVLRRHRGRVSLQVVGAIGDRTLLRALEGLSVEVLDDGRPYEYDAFVGWMLDRLRWDIALAPLEQTVFTRCKSDLKFLDYGALGVAGIYSRVTPYVESVRHGETGWLADNQPEAWREALETLIADRDLRRGIAQRAREHVAAHRTLAQTAAEWPRAIRGVVQGRTA
jgi:glycosyltransferase involved in cell wall biosynthesis